MALDPRARVAGKRLLIVGVNYWPEPTGIAPYTTGLAEQLASAGAEVTVATAHPHYPMWRIPEEYSRFDTLTEVRNGVTVHRVRPSVPERMGAASRAWFEASFGWRVRRIVDVTDADAVIAVIPSLAGAAVGRRVARRRRIPFGIIFQDLIGRAAEQSGTAGKGIAAAIAAVERRLAGAADRVAVVATGFATFLNEAGIAADSVCHLPNWCHIQPPAHRASDVRHRLGWAEHRAVALHAGNMGAKQALENVIAAARLASERHPEIHFVLMGDGSRRKWLQAAATGLPNLQFLEPQPAEIFPAILTAADVLLVNERATVRDMSLPSKLTSYFSAGRPVIAAVRADGTTAAEVQRAGGGIVVPPEDPRALVDAISRVAGQPSYAGQLGAAGRRYAAEYLNEAAAAERSVAFAADLLNSRN